MLKAVGRGSVRTGASRPSPDNAQTPTMTRFKDSESARRRISPWKRKPEIELRVRVRGRVRLKERKRFFEVRGSERAKICYSPTRFSLLPMVPPIVLVLEYLELVRSNSYRFLSAWSFLRVAIFTSTTARPISRPMAAPCRRSGLQRPARLCGRLPPENRTHSSFRCLPRRDSGLHARNAMLP
jgi:hypothetical protein